MRIVRLPHRILPWGSRRRSGSLRPRLPRIVTRGRGPRRQWPSGRLLLWPAALLAATLLFAVSDARTTPTSGEPSAAWRHAGAPEGLPASSATLRYLFAEGLPTLGLWKAPPGPLTPGTGLRLGAFAAYTLTGVAPLAPQTVLESAFTGFGFVRGGPGAHLGSLNAWLANVGAQQHAGKAAQTLPKAPAGFDIYGKGAPVVFIYATEGEGAFAGQQPQPNAPPPTTTNRQSDVLGLAQQLAKDLGGAGVPTLFANRFNDGEGELGAYLNSGNLLGATVHAYSGLSLILDVERPVVPSGPAAVRLHGQPVATMTLLVGTNARLADPAWHQNLDLAKTLGAFFARSAPGVFLGIQESPDRLNQELATTALTLDFGGPSATPAEARNALQYAVQAIIAYLSGQSVPPNP